MTADINVILQLLQRQMVPPAYSTVSPAALTPSPASLYNHVVPLQVSPSTFVVDWWSAIGRSGV